MRAGRFRPYFNSIKVRLKLHDGWTMRVIIIAFQFHKGTIKTLTLCIMIQKLNVISIP